MKSLFIPMVCLALGLSAGCAESPVDVAVSSATIELVNAVCPIMGSPVDGKDIDPAMVKDWNGRKVGFCCPPCLEEWDELSDAEKADRLAHPGGDHAAHGHSDADHASDAGHASGTDEPAEAEPDAISAAAPEASTPSP